MAKTFIQKPGVVLETKVALNSGSVLTGSFLSAGYAKLEGLFWANASSTASGIRIAQSSNYGANWDYENLYTISPSVASAFDISIYGNAIKITASMGATSASLMRAYFWLRPI